MVKTISNSITNSAKIMETKIGRKVMKILRLKKNLLIVPDHKLDLN